MALNVKLMHTINELQTRLVTGLKFAGVHEASINEAVELFEAIAAEKDLGSSEIALRNTTVLIRQEIFALGKLRVGDLSLFQKLLKTRLRRLFTAMMADKARLLTEPGWRAFLARSASPAAEPTPTIEQDSRRSPTTAQTRGTPSANKRNNTALTRSSIAPVEQASSTQSLQATEVSSADQDVRKGDLNRRFVAHMLNKICEHPDAEPFLDPVDPIKDQCPDYYEKIRWPMDLHTIKEKFKNGEYGGNKEVVYDISLMLKNCYTYNGYEHDVSKRGKGVEAEVKRLLDGRKEWMETQAARA